MSAPKWTAEEQAPEFATAAPKWVDEAPLAQTEAQDSPFTDKMLAFLESQTYGFAPKVSAASQAYFNTLSNALSGEGSIDFGKTFRESVPDWKREYARAAAENPKTNIGGSFAAFNPFLASKLVGPGVSLGTKMAAGAGGGAFGGLMSALGHDENAVPSTLFGAGIGAALPGVGAAVAKPLEKLSTWAGGKVSKAWADAVAQRLAKGEKAVRSEISSKGGESSAGARSIEQLKAAIDDPNLSPQLRKEAADLLGTQEATQLLTGVTEGNLERLPGQLGRIQAADEALQLAKAANTPEQQAIEVAAQMAQPWEAPSKFAKKYVLNRYLAPAVGGFIGGQIGGPLGMAAGMGAGALTQAVGGHGATAVSNMAKNPALRAGVAGKIQGAADLGAGVTEAFAGPHMSVRMSPVIRYLYPSEEEALNAAAGHFVAPQQPEDEFKGKGRYE